MKTLSAFVRYAFWVFVIVFVIWWLVGDRLPIPGYRSGGGFFG